MAPNLMKGILRGKTSIVKQDDELDTLDLASYKKNALHRKNEFDEWSAEMKKLLKEKAKQNISETPKR